MGDRSREQHPDGIPEGAPQGLAPIRAKRVSQAERVVANARARKEREGDVASLPSTRLERKDVNGKPTLTAIFAGSTPFPRTVELRLKTFDLAALLYDACAGCGTARGSRTGPPAPRRESGIDGGSRALV